MTITTKYNGTNNIAASTYSMPQWRYPTRPVEGAIRKIKATSVDKWNSEGIHSLMHPPLRNLYPPFSEEHQLVTQPYSFQRTPLTRFSKWGPKALNLTAFSICFNISAIWADGTKDRTDYSSERRWLRPL